MYTLRPGKRFVRVEIDRTVGPLVDPATPRIADY